MSLVEFDTYAGEPISIRYSKKKLIPFSTKTTFGKQNRFGLVWHRPASVAVENPDGTIEVLKIEDVTRKLQLAILGFGILGSILIALVYGNSQQGAIND